MFEVFKSPTIKEDTSKNQIIVEGINLKLVYRDFEKYIGSRMLYNILDKSGRWEMKFQKFYLPDMYHVVLELLNNDKFKRRIVSRSKLQKLKELFETIPLVQNIKLIQNTKDEDIPSVNKSILKNIFVPGFKLFEHQDKFIDNCLFKSKLMDLRGYLLDAGPGLGKTINSIALMELLGADKIIVVCPKKAVIDVWEETINRIYSKPQTYNLSIDSVVGGKVKLANFSLDSKFMVCHFEALDKLVASLKNIPNARYGIVLDECLHPDTEVLTPTGFKPIKDITTEDTVLQYNPDGSNSWVSPSRVVKKPTLESHHYINSRWEQLVTPNHRMIFKKQRSMAGIPILGEKLSKDFYPGHGNKAIVSGFLENNGKTKLTPLERLLIAIQADGSINDISKVRKYIKIELHLVKQRKIDRLLDILKDIDVEYSIYHSKSEYVNGKRILIKIPFEMLSFIEDFESSPKKIKYLNSWVDLSDKSSDWCSEFMEELVEWDGYKSFPVDGVYKYTYYSSTDSINADIVQLIAANAGIRIKRSLSVDNRKETYKDNHRINMMKVSLVDNRVTQKVINKYDEPVDFYCITVPSGMFYVRYNNKVSVTGNCHGLNSYKSQRSTLFRELVKIVNPYFCLWMSGTPLKALGSETMTMFETIDKLFTPEVVKSFTSVFGISGVYAASVMANRLQLVKATIKSQGSGVEQFTYQSKVVLPDAWKYTLSTIREEMKKYIKERTAFYNEFRDDYIEEYFEGIEEFKSNLGSNFDSKMQIALDEYLAKTKELHNGYNPTSPVHKQYIIDCNYFEDKVIIPILSNKTKKIFRKAKSVYKYVELTIIGETLGNVIGRKRTECNKAIVEAMAKSFTVVNEESKETYETNLGEVIRDAEAKTLIFTDYVDVLKRCNEILIEEGFHPITIFGETTTTIGLPNQVKQFRENSKINPLITTFKTLSEAMPLTEANTVIFLNLPFRSGTYDQAVKRANRIGQTKDVHLYEVTLDTGGEENISTRNLDILKWSEEQVSILMGDKKGEVEEVSKLTIDHFLPDMVTRGIPSIKDFKMF